ncbi:MAG TPA: DNA polymerase I [Pseudomonadales bacterium]|jgi:DNA polymerase-1|nr:DNA polymerase I [Pseudomonadales bacterium]HMZ91424.1 DNA polymerase I [Pseudomonadales bacterium]HNB83459.1 DNA polymerase I [Pseudomonadales bacterium]HNC76627.1 DNA polymerase I [Pseudomonadales bacterium]HND26840.1 DNA polymerase I [Pseudomonadales bacterium]
MSETQNRPRQLVLVDGSSYLYRAYYALPPLSTRDGAPTGAVKGVISMVRKLLKEYPDATVVVVFDAKGKTFRDELFAQYKSHRPPMPTDLAQQIEPIQQIIRALGLPLLVVEGVEADDVIGTLARQATEMQIPTVISTGDKDMAQLVNGHVTLINTMTDTRLDRAGVEQKFGLPPELIRDYLALVGDSSDNIPGVPQVGPKTAVKWLSSHGDLDGLLAQAAEIPGKVGESLRLHLDQLALSRQLATIRCDLELPIDLATLQYGEVDRARLVELFAQLEFNSWLDEYRDKQPASASHLPLRHETLLTAEQFERWLQKLTAAANFVIDTETSSLDCISAQLVGLAFAVEPGEAAYLPLRHDYPDVPPQLDCDWVLSRLRPLLEDPGHGKIGQNLKFDLGILARHGIALRGIAEDTMLESYVLNSTASRHDMDSLALRYLGRQTISFEQIAGKGSKQLSFNQIALEQAAPYAAEDAEVPLRLHQVLGPQLDAEPRLRQVYRELELPLVPILSRIERAGVLIDAERLTRHSGELAVRIAELEQQAWQLAGATFNLGSPKQLQEIFYERLQLPVLQRTPTGQPSTAEAVLQELALDYPLPKVLLEHRSLSKLKSTYTDRLPEQIHPLTGRVHTSYHQAVTATGRLSSSDPNLQNIPIRTSEGRRIRQAIIAPAGHQLLAADYSQIELRIMAHLSGDAGLLNAFGRGLDVHRATAAEVQGIPYEQVTSEERRRAKAVNFGLIYGMSAFGLARQLGISRNEAQGYIDGYFSRYPGVLDYMERIRQTAREQGYVETLHGRRLHVPEIHARDQARRRAAERTAINAPMQGSAADIIKLAMIQLDEWLERTRAPARMIMQVHDELVLEVANEALEQVRPEVKRIMEQVTTLAVPLLVEIGTGPDWDVAAQR